MGHFPAGGGGVGTIDTIESTDGTLAVTGGSGPTANLSAAPLLVDTHLTGKPTVNGGDLILPFFPESYGAVGNGTTDDTTAVQNCINAAAAVSGTWVLAQVQFRAAPYLVSGLTLPPGTTLQGVNSQTYYNATLTVPNPNTQTVLLLSASATVPIITPNDTGNKATVCNIFDIAFNGNGVTLATAATTRIGSCLDLPDQVGSISRFWNMERLYFFNVGGTGSDHSYAVNIGNQNTACVMRDCTLFNGTSGSPSGTNGLAWYGSDNRAENCFIGYFATTGLQTLGGTSDQTFFWNGGGIFTCGTNASIGGGGMVFEGCSFDHAATDGVYINNGPVFFTDCTFHNNSLQTNGQSSNIRVAGNNVQVTFIGCRAALGSAGNQPKLHINVTGTGCTINEFGSVNEGVPFTIGWTNYITVPAITGATVSGTTVTITAPGIWTAGQPATVTGLANGTGANWANANGVWPILAGGNGSFTFTVATGTPTGTSNNAGEAFVVGSTLISPVLITPTMSGVWPVANGGTGTSAFGTVHTTPLASSTPLTIDSALHTLVTSPSLEVGTWLVTANVVGEGSTTTKTFVDFAIALGSAVGSIAGVPATSLATSTVTFETIPGFISCIVTVTTAGTVVLEYESTSTGGGMTAIPHGINTNLGVSTGITAVRIG